MTTEWWRRISIYYCAGLQRECATTTTWAVRWKAARPWWTTCRYPWLLSRETRTLRRKTINLKIQEKSRRQRAHLKLLASEPQTKAPFINLPLQTAATVLVSGQCRALRQPPDVPRLQGQIDKERFCPWLIRCLSNMWMSADRPLQKRCHWCGARFNRAGRVIGLYPAQTAEGAGSSLTWCRGI